MSRGGVLVVGGGIGGLSTSVALRNVGYDVHVVEIRPDLRSSVTGVGIIQPVNALRALEAIGCGEECLEAGHSSTTWGCSMWTATCSTRCRGHDPRFGLVALERSHPAAAARDSDHRGTRGRRHHRVRQDFREAPRDPGRGRGGLRRRNQHRRGRRRGRRRPFAGPASCRGHGGPTGPQRSVGIPVHRTPRAGRRPDRPAGGPGGLRPPGPIRSASSTAPRGTTTIGRIPANWVSLQIGSGT
ncbi:FAD-dependent monooxygenase [Halosaccharopolyspora lacisalsi]